MNASTICMFPRSCVVTTVLSILYNVANNMYESFAVNAVWVQHRLHNNCMCDLDLHLDPAISVLCIRVFDDIICVRK